VTSAKQMKKMKCKDYTVPLVLILGGFFLWVIFVFSIHDIVATIETEGLKAIFGQIWCGSNGC
jgi:hypothetical protein